jgi:hypothetical protein
MRRVFSASPRRSSRSGVRGRACAFDCATNPSNRNASCSARYLRASRRSRLSLRVEKKNQALTSKKKTLSLSDDGKDKVKPAITSNLSSKFSGSKNPSRGSIYSKIKSTDRSTTSLFLRSGESTRSQFAPDAVSLPITTAKVESRSRRQRRRTSSETHLLKIKRASSREIIAALSPRPKWIEVMRVMRAADLTTKPHLQVLLPARVSSANSNESGSRSCAHARSDYYALAVEKRYQGIVSCSCAHGSTAAVPPISPINRSPASRQPDP